MTADLVAILYPSFLIRTTPGRIVLRQSVAFGEIDGLFAHGKSDFGLHISKNKLLLPMKSTTNRVTISAFSVFAFLNAAVTKPNENMVTGCGLSERDLFEGFQSLAFQLFVFNASSFDSSCSVDNQLDMETVHSYFIFFGNSRQRMLTASGLR